MAVTRKSPRRERVLVTGAAGFIGRWSVRELLRAGHEVHAVVSGAPGRQIPSEIAGASLHAVDLLDVEEVDALLRDIAPRLLLHFAWIATPGLYWTSPANSSWLGAGRRLLESFGNSGGSRVVMAGSCAEYDWSRAGICNERTTPLADEVAPSGGGTTPRAAITPYAAAKLAMSRELASYASAHGMSSAWGRIFFLYGPGEKRERLAASVITDLLAGRAALCSHGRQERNFLHVADAGSAFASLLQSTVEGPVNIGSTERVTVAELVHEIAVQLKRPDLVRLGARPASPVEPPLLVPDVSRLRNEVRWRAGYSLSEGIADSIEWWRSQSRAQTASGSQP